MSTPEGSEVALGVEALKNLFDREQVELQRSAKVQQQLSVVLPTLQTRCNELERENAELRAKVLADERCAMFESEVEAARKDLDVLMHESSELDSDVARLRAERSSQEEGAAQLRQVEAEAAKECVALEQRCHCNEVLHEEALTEARSMICSETLERAAAESIKLQEQLAEQEAEAARLRQALADSWAKRGEPPDEGDFDGDVAASQSDGKGGASNLDDLDNVEEELKWLAKMQQDASAEVHHLQHLERTECAREARFQKLSEEKAALQSKRVDLSDAGKTMREAIASSSECYVREVGGLEEERRNTDQDRVKLIQECADLQARLSSMEPELKDLEEIEGRYNQMDAEHRSLETRSRRLRDVNGALGAQLLGDAGSPSAAAGSDSSGTATVAEALTRVLQLHRRFVERQQAHNEEKHKLVARIQALERENAGISIAASPEEEPQAPKQAPSSQGGAWGGLMRQGTSQTNATEAGATEEGYLGSVTAQGGAAIATATSALRGGLSRLLT